MERLYTQELYNILITPLDVVLLIIYHMYLGNLRNMWNKFILLQKLRNIGRSQILNAGL